MLRLKEPIYTNYKIFMEEMDGELITQKEVSLLKEKTKHKNKQLK